MNIESIKDYFKKIPEKGGLPRKGAVVCVGLMLAGTIIGFSAHHAKLENQYEQAIELTCNEQYDEALTLLEQLGDYEDSESLQEFIAVKQDFSIEDKDSYIDVLAKLDDMDFSDDAELEDHFETFEQKVESLQQQYEKDQEQAQKITLKISNIAGGDLTTLTLDDESSITEARNLYAQGSESVRELVYNYSKLLKAEQAMEKLVEHRALCMEQAKPAVDAITAIGDVTLDSKDSITNARTIYDGLSSEEYKKYVTNYETLVFAEKKIQRIGTRRNSQAKGSRASCAETTRRTAAKFLFRLFIGYSVLGSKRKRLPLHCILSDIGAVKAYLFRNRQPVWKAKAM